MYDDPRTAHLTAEQKRNIGSVDRVRPPGHYPLIFTEILLEFCNDPALPVYVVPMGRGRNLKSQRKKFRAFLKGVQDNPQQRFAAFIYGTWTIQITIDEGVHQFIAKRYAKPSKPSAEAMNALQNTLRNRKLT